MNSPVELQTGQWRLFLPPPSDAERVARFMRAERSRWAQTTPGVPETHFTAGYWEGRLARNRASYRAGRSLRLFVQEGASRDGPLVGAVNLHQILRGGVQSCTLGFHVAESHEGRGVMTLGVGAVIRFAFEQMHLHRIVAYHLPENQRSARLLQRLGFVREGVARGYLAIDGQWRDHVVLSRLNPTSPIPHPSG